MNLNERDPFFILVILMVATMFISTKMTTTDPKQSFITYAMPVIFGAISWNLPAGILVYWITTNIWSIGQQYIVNRFVKREAKKLESQKKSTEQQKRIEAVSAEIIEPVKRKKRRKKRK
jgi:YidC/Oxa1 family membrane protein insertase